MKDYALKKENATADLGMANFAISTVAFTVMGIPLTHASPLYYADPMGAIVGRNLKTPFVPGAGKKTVGGTLAVIFTGFLSLHFIAGAEYLDAAITAIIIGFIELYSGEWDNSAICGGLAVRYFIFFANKSYLEEKK